VLGEPHRHYACVHVGGTNGKGSVSTFLAAALRAAGFRVGLYTSPHLVSFLERITVDGQPATEEAVTAWTARLEGAALTHQASFFEITTAVAFADFAARGVEIAVVEVGLGGRLDATNVIVPLACGVTRIAREHTEYLGDDLRGIAREKAAIAKRGVPFLTTERDEDLVEAMRDVVAAQGATLRWVDPRLASGMELGLRGPHQVANASLAMALALALPDAFRPDADAIAAGFAAARIPGRYDRRGPYLFDVAHNPDGMRALVGALRAEPPPRPVAAVVAVLRDKAWREMLTLLAPEVDALVLTRAPSAPLERAWDLDDVADWAAGQGFAAAVEPGLDNALAAARRMGTTVLVTGSFHTVGDAMARLPGFAPLG
jgi:dihydrofolate synthase/folylpolyglutamate synthase